MTHSSNETFDEMVGWKERALNAENTLQNMINEFIINQKKAESYDCLFMQLTRTEGELRQAYENLETTQKRCTELVEEARSVKRITLNELRDAALRIATEHGFDEASVLEDFCLMHSEISEALEDYRKGNKPNHSWFDAPTTIRKPRGIPTEMADVIIRILHFCGKHNINIEAAVLDKMAYNDTRPYKHGKII